ncbi:YihY/virulence factor BrkB family protein [Candidatus Roizmanbacteria bacterium]|nr:YihY/virulence factor BrkB family protein [Candidatus Roizmanbacteria bacterium]
MYRIKRILGILRHSFYEFQKDKVEQMAAAITFYALFAIAPLFIIIFSFILFVLRQPAIFHQIVNVIQTQYGDYPAMIVQNILQTEVAKTYNLLPAIISFIVSLIGATSFFLHIQEYLDTIWDSRPSGEYTITRQLKNRLLTLLFALFINLILLALILINTILPTLIHFFYTTIPISLPELSVYNQIFFFILLIIMLMLAYRYLSHARFPIRYLLIGSLVTAVLMGIGRIAIELYFLLVPVGTIYGAAGSLLVFMLAIYYFAQLFLFGAEFIKVVTLLHL